MIEEPEVVIHKADESDSIADHLDTDCLASKEGAEIDRLGGLFLQSDRACVRDGPSAVMTGLDAFDVDPQPEPPHRDFGEAERAWGLAKGAALFARMALGKPKSLNTRSKTVNA